MNGNGAERRDEAVSRSTLGTIRNATLILKLLSDGRTYHAISDLAQRSGLPLATLHRLLRSLALAGLVEQHPETSRYGLGPELLRLAARHLNRLPALRVLSPYLVELRNATGATIEVSVLVAGDVVRVDRLDGGEAGIFREPQHVDAAFSTAAGRVLLGRTDDETWTAAAAAAPEFGEPDRRHWATADYLTLPVGEQLEVAVPVLDRRDRTVAALSALVPASAGSPETEQRLATRLLRVTKVTRKAIGDG